MLSNKECQKKLAAMSPADFNDTYLFNDGNWYFEESPDGGQFGDYHDFKKLVGKAFGIRPHGVVIVGSAKLGYSLSPPKKFKVFDDKSDIDVAIVSAPHFESIWEAVLHAHYSGVPIKKEETIDGLLMDDIFRRFITLREDFEFVSNHLRDAQVLLGEVQKKVAAPLAISNTLKFRIYRDVDSLHSYHEWSTAKLVEELMKGS